MYLMLPCQEEDISRRRREGEDLPLPQTSPPLLPSTGRVAPSTLDGDMASYWID